MSEKDLENNEHSSYRSAYRKEQEITEDDTAFRRTDLAEIVGLWPELPEYIKAAIQALVQIHIEEKD